MAVPTDRLDAPRTLILLAAGAALWAGGVLLIRALQSAGALGGGLTAAVYLAVAGATWPLVRFAPRLLGLADRAALACAGVMAATAALIDAVVVRWLPQVYADDPRRVAEDAAALLWAIGVAVALGALASARAARVPRS